MTTPTKPIAEIVAEIKFLEGEFDNSPAQFDTATGKVKMMFEEVAIEGNKALSDLAGYLLCNYGSLLAELTRLTEENKQLRNDEDERFWDCINEAIGNWGGKERDCFDMAYQRIRDVKDKP